MDSQIAFGHVRLSIIDLVGGQQPRHCADSGNALVFNGEIYGYKQLAESLQQQGKALADHSDTEVLFQLLCTGPAEDVLDRIDGMFAFAYRDGGSGRLYLARDRFGEKPLFYGISDGTLVFGSEISAVRQHPSFQDAGIDREAAGQFLTLQFLPGQDSGYEGIRKLPPGHLLEFKNGHAQIRRYWTPRIGVASNPRTDQTDEIEGLLSDSVRERLVADVPVGIFLSGGLDSSVIAALAARHQPDVSAFSIAMDDESHDESPYAAEVARHLGLPHFVSHFTSGDLEQACEKVLGKIDEPLADASLLPTFLLCQAARTRVKVALGGDGADELFAGYPNFRARRFSPMMALIPAAAGAALRHAVDLVPQKPDYMGFGFKLKQLSYGFGEDPDYQSHQWMAAFSEVEQSELWRSEAAPARAAGGLREDTLARLVEYAQLSGLERLQHVFLAGYLAEDILPKIDRASMYNGLEVRAPFLSRQFAEHALGLPFRDKLRRGCTKYALKTVAARLLPASIVKRKKHGFAPPMARMLRSTLKARIEALLFDPSNPVARWFRTEEIRRYWQEHQSGKRDHHRKLWTLAVLFQVALRP